MAMISPSRHLSDEPFSIEQHTDGGSGSGSRSSGGSRSGTGNSSHTHLKRPSSPLSPGTATPLPDGQDGYHSGAGDDLPLSPLPSTIDRKASLIPEFAPSPTDDTTLISTHLSHRRKSTILHRHRRRQSSTQVPGGRPEDHIEPFADLDLGEETAAERAEREMMDVQADKAEREARGAWGERVGIRAYGQEWGQWGEDEEEGVNVKGLKPGFAWDGTFCCVLLVTRCVLMKQ